MAYQNKKTVDSIYDLPKALRAAMDKKLGGVMVAFKEDITEETQQEQEEEYSNDGDDEGTPSEENGQGYENDEE